MVFQNNFFFGKNIKIGIVKIYHKGCVFHDHCLCSRENLLQFLASET